MRLWELIRFRWGHKGGALLMGSHKKRLQSACSASLHPPLTLPREGRATICRPGRGLSLGNRISQCLDLGLPSFQNCKKQMTVYWCLSHPNLYQSVTAAQTDWFTISFCCSNWPTLGRRKPCKLSSVSFWHTVPTVSFVLFWTLPFWNYKVLQVI